MKKMAEEVVAAEKRSKMELVAVLIGVKVTVQGPAEVEAAVDCSQQLSNPGWARLP